MHVKTAEYTHSAAKPSQFVKRPVPHFVFAGRSNVGKSSLLNALLNRKSLAHTSKTPGKTRLVNYFLVNDRLFFVDLPGYGFAKVSKKEQEQWGKLVDAYLRETPYIATVFLLMDIRHDPSAHDKQMLEWLLHYQIPFNLILTKADKLSKSQVIRQRAQFARIFGLAPEIIFATSSANKFGVQDVWSQITHHYHLMRELMFDSKETSC